jgi:putative ABC transport system substrate-binding protein
MKKKVIGLALSALLFALCGSVDAQQPTKLPRIGRLAVASHSAESDRIEAFRRGLRKLGYVEGRNIVIEWRFADGEFGRLPAHAAELVRLKVHVIVTSGSTPTRIARAATSTIPIVMSNDNDPVGDDFVASLARPGGNITGLSNFAPELSGKRLEILREVVPKLSHLGILGTSTNPGYAQSIKEVKLAAAALGVKFEYLDALNPENIETAFRTASKWRVDGVLVLTSGILVAQRVQVAELAAKHHLPAIYPNSQFVEADGLMFYGVHVIDLDRRAATYVDKILKGAKPADLPVEQPTKFEFIINLKAAKQVGLTIPPNVLARADRVIR